MTQTIVIGENKPTKPTPKYIKFNIFLNDASSSKRAAAVPRNYDYIELICQNYNQSGHDLMYAYDNPNTRAGSLYFGKWNDGIVDKSEI